MAVVVGGLVLGRLAPVKVIDSTVATPLVVPGGTFALHRHVAWLRSDCTDVRISAEVIDSLAPAGYHHAMQSIDLGAPRPDITDTGREWQIPFQMPWGEATYRAYLAFECFPFYGLWPIEVALPELKFTVVPKSK
jgi:hypothetical protein